MGEALAIISLVVAVFFWLFRREQATELFTLKPFRMKALEKKRQKLVLATTPRHVQEWMIDYYTSKGQNRHLYMMSTISSKPVIPFLTRPEWVLSGRAPDSVLVFPTEPQISHIKHDTKTINQRINLFGQRMELKPIYCATRLIRSDVGFQVEVGYGDYFQFISACGPLMDEALFSITFNKKTPYRDQKASTLDFIETFPCKAHAIGIHSIVVGKRKDGEWSTIMHMRSRKVAINVGAFTGVPTCTFQPHTGSEEFDRSIFNCFLREYLEENYNKEMFIDDETNRPRPDWFYELPEMKPVLELLKRGEAKFYMLGFGFDPGHCDLVFCICLVIDNPEYWEKALHEMIMNWEAKKETRPYNLEHLLYSKEVDELLMKRLIQPGTAYCIDQVRLLLRERSSKPSRRASKKGKSA